MLILVPPARGTILSKKEDNIRPAWRGVAGGCGVASSAARLPAGGDENSGRRLQSGAEWRRVAQSGGAVLRAPPGRPAALPPHQSARRHAAPAPAPTPPTPTPANTPANTPARTPENTPASPRRCYLCGSGRHLPPHHAAVASCCCFISERRRGSSNFRCNYPTVTVVTVQ